MARRSRDQLSLLTPEPDWHLDDKTREIGLQGVARARETLRRARAEAESGTSTIAPGPQHRPPAERQAAEPDILTVSSEGAVAIAAAIASSGSEAQQLEPPQELPPAQPTE